MPSSLRYRSLSFFSGVPIALSVLLAPAPCAAELLVTPTRIQLSDVARVTSLTLTHHSPVPVTYALSTVFYRMTPEGVLERVDDPGVDGGSAMPLIRFSPKRVTLPPGEEQTVRVMISGGRQLPEGDYRAHVTFTPESGEPAVPVKVEGAGKGVDVTMSLKIAVAIPLVYRHGKPSAAVKLSEIQLQPLRDGRGAVTLSMTTEGKAFPYGDFEIALKQEDGEGKVLGVTRGIAGYAAKRKVIVPIEWPKGVSPGQPVEVRFLEPKDAGGKPIASETKTF